MKNTLSHVLVSLLLVLLTLALIPAALAEDAPPADQISSDLTSSYYEWRNPERSAGFSISYVDIGITAGSGSVLVSATTESSISVDCVGGYVRIQQWKDSKWTTIKNISFYGYDTDSCSMTRSVSVERGYYYRVLGVHTADLDSEYVSKGTSTSSIYVN